MRSVRAPLLLLALVTPLAAQTTTLITASAAGDPCDANSLIPCLTDNGRYLLFTTSATDLIEGDTAGVSEPVVEDLKQGTLTRVALDDAGTPADGASTGWGTSANGRFAVFESAADNLVPSDTNGALDVFVRDLKLGTTTRVSVSSAGDEADSDSQAARISPNGRYVVFQSSASNLGAPAGTPSLVVIYLRDFKKGVTEAISVGATGESADAGSSRATVSANGRWVAFTSFATNLVAGDTNGKRDVFVRDRKKGVTTRVSVTSAGEELVGGTFGSFIGAIAANGKYVAFATDAPGLDPVDLNGLSDVYVHSMKKGTVQRISVGFDGSDADGISALASDTLWISGNARWIAFSSGSSNLVADDPNGGVADVFVADRVKHKTVLASLSFDGQGANQAVSECAVSNDGKRVGFSSFATNLPEGSSGGPAVNRQIFLHDAKK